MRILVQQFPELAYLEQELNAPLKSEYHNGEILNMAGAKEEHNLIVANIIVELGICLKGKNCKIYPSDMLLKLEQCKKYVYPDVMVVCQTAEIERKSEKGADTLLNPSIVIEVLSPSTALYDKVEKKRCYQMLDCLQQYVMIDSAKIEVTSYTRTAEGWLLEILQDLTESIQIGECLIQLHDLYAQVVFEE
ncbi:MAG: Uma2 family endonuclease [Bacteroidetes bacterium]|nr:MAG: Uma2 family endonuclease [Bacteroidota bacterium]